MCCCIQKQIKMSMTLLLNILRTVFTINPNIYETFQQEGYVTTMLHDGNEATVYSHDYNGIALRDRREKQKRMLSASGAGNTAVTNLAQQMEQLGDDIVAADVNQLPIHNEVIVGAEVNNAFN